MTNLRTKPEPFTEAQLAGAEELRKRLAHILPPTFDTDFFLARWHRAYAGDLDQIERRLSELIAHRQAIGYGAAADASKSAAELEFSRKTFERFGISTLRMDVFSDDVVVFLQKMKGVDIKEIMKVIPLGHVLNAYYVMQECFHRAMIAHEASTHRPSAAVIVIDLEGLVISDFINPLSAPSKLAKYIVKIWSDYFSENLIRLYLINPPAILSIMWQVTKQIVDTKMQLRVVFVSKVNDLHEFLAKEAIPVDYGGTRRDTSGFAETADSCISRSIPVRPEEYFCEPMFWRRFGAISQPSLAHATLKPKQDHFADVKCVAGQTLVWLFTTGSEVTFDVAYFPNGHTSSKETIVWPRITLTTLKIPEIGWVKCEKTGTYRARFGCTTGGWLIAPKVAYKIGAFPGEK